MWCGAGSAAGYRDLVTSAPPPPSYDELAALVVELKLLVAVQAATIAEQVQEIAELKRRLAADSHNSSRPPSSDGLVKKPAPKSLRKRTGRKPGRGKGDPGGRLEQVADPDVILDHRPASCGGCGDDLTGVESWGYRARQVFDLPEVKPEVTEHRLHEVACGGCGQMTGAAAPDGVSAQSVYGPGVRAAIAYLSAYQHLPAKRLAEAMESLFGLPISTGTVQRVLAGAHDRLAPFEEQIKQHLKTAPLAHADESGVRVAGKLHWLHVMCTHLVTFYGIHAKRGRIAMDSFGVLPAFNGTLVTDALASYTIYGDAHALCGAHALRELIAVTEDNRHDTSWAQAMIDVLIEAKDAIADAVTAGESHLGPDALDGFQERYRQAALCGISAHPYAGTGPKSKARALAMRLRDKIAEYTRYMVDFSVPFDNNQAERDLRMIKVQQKVSGSWRTLTGAQRFARIRSYISTIRKHGINPLTALRDLFDGRPWMLPETA
jgi:transposase